MRGFGQAPTNYAIETAIDKVAASLGLDRIEAIVTDLGRSASPDQVAEGLIAGVREACTTPLRDDATVVVVNFEGATPGAR